MKTALFYLAAGVTRSTLNTKKRERLFATIRHIIAYEMRKSGMSYERIANELSYNDHTTALAAVRKIEMLLATDKTMKSIHIIYLDELHRQIENNKDIYKEKYSIQKSKKKRNRYHGLETVGRLSRSTASVGQY